MDNIQSEKGIREGGCNTGQYWLVKSLDFQSPSQAISLFQESLTLH